MTALLWTQTQRNMAATGGMLNFLVIVAITDSAWSLSCYKCSHSYYHTGERKIDKFFADAVSINEECTETGKDYTEHEVASECEIPDTDLYDVEEFEVFCSKISIKGTASFAGRDVTVESVHRGCRIYHPSMGHRPEPGCHPDVTHLLSGDNLRAKDIVGAICFCPENECNTGSHVTRTCSLHLVLAAIVTAFIAS